MAIKKVISGITAHPLTRKHKLNALARFVMWQLRSRLAKSKIKCAFVNNTYLLVQRGMTGATGNIYCGLLEFEEMGFLLHYLRSDDAFVDIGANVGVYTVLASGVVGAQSITFEPVPATFHHLIDNITINNMSDRVKVYNMGVGAQKAQLYFTGDKDTVNHVIAEKDVDSNSVKVDVTVLDDYIGFNPALMKIDVEGFELDVLKGGIKVLDLDSLQAIIIELNGSGRKYGNKDEDVVHLLQEKGFKPVEYNVFERTLKPIDHLQFNDNVIFVKDVERVKERVKLAPSFKVLRQSL